MAISAKEFDCSIQKVFFERRNETLLTCEFESVRYDVKQQFVVNTNETVIKKIMNIEETTQLLNIEETTQVVNISKNISDASLEQNVVDPNDLVQQVKFKWSKLPQIANQIFRKFKNLIIFDGSNIKLRNLNSLSFNSAGNLEMIFLQNNQLTSLNAYCFVHSKNLTLLNLSNNKIYNIQGLAFAALNMLETLTLSNNNLKSIEDTTFQPLTSLKWIGLDNNRLTIISSDIFVGMKNTLKGIYLNNNKIEMISPYAFEQLNQHRFLTLSSNQCVNEDFLNHVIHDNSAIKFELRGCYNEYRKHDFSEDDKYSPKISLDNFDDANKNCVYDSIKIITQLFEVQNQLSSS